MERLMMLVGLLYKFVGLTEYFFKVDRFMALVGIISRPVESPLQCINLFSKMIFEKRIKHL